MPLPPGEGASTRRKYDWPSPFTTPHRCPAALDGRRAGFRPLLESDPEIVADVLVLSARSKMEGGNDFREDLYDLALSENHATVAGLAALPLLTSLPVRCTARQMPGLGILLQAALLYSEETALLELIDRKLVYRGMNVGQRVHWLAAGFLAAPDKFREALESYVAGNERRVRHLAAFAAGDDFPAALIGRLDVRMLRVLIRLIGSTYRPYSPRFPGNKRHCSTSDGVRSHSRIHRQAGVHPDQRRYAVSPRFIVRSQPPPVAISSHRCSIPAERHPP